MFTTNYKAINGKTYSKEVKIERHNGELVVMSNAYGMGSVIDMVTAKLPKLNKALAVGLLPDDVHYLAVPESAKALVWEALNECLAGDKAHLPNGKTVTLVLPPKRCERCGEMMCPDRCCCGC